MINEIQKDIQPAVHSFSSEELKGLCLSCGADDVGFVSVLDRGVDADREDIKLTAPWTKTLISFVVKMNRESVRSPARSIGNNEFHHTGEKVNEIAHDIVRKLEDKGIRAVNPAMGFPMEMQRFPGKIWVVSHKNIAVAAGLGAIGIHRNVIHPQFGNFILLGTILTDLDVHEYNIPLDYNPCVECKLCVAACPVGAISSDGHFNFSACYTHNYREFMGGFTDWAEKLTDCPNSKSLRKEVSDAESVSMWQSLSYGPNYKSAYCMAVCPAGEDVMAPFQSNRSQFQKDIVKPLQDRKETVYVLKDSEAQQHAAKRYPHKDIKIVRNSLRPADLGVFFNGLHLLFNRQKSKGWSAVYHFDFFGKEQRKETVIIKDKVLQTCTGHQGRADILVTADTNSWLSFVRKEKHLIPLLLRRKIRLKGDPRLLIKFGQCFPG